MQLALGITILFLAAAILHVIWMRGVWGNKSPLWPAIVAAVRDTTILFVLTGAAFCGFLLIITYRT